MPSFNDFFLGMAEYVSTKSKDKSTKVGAVIVGPNNEVLSVGWNGFPRGVNDDVEERHERPAKYEWTEHGERNAIYNAARHGIRLDGTTLYTTHDPCADCARAIVQSGIRHVVTLGGSTIGGRGAVNVADTILTEGCVKVSSLGAT